MSESCVARPLSLSACLIAAALALAGCDADPHVPAVVRAPSPVTSASAPRTSSTQAAAATLSTPPRSGLAPPVMHTVD